MVKIYYISALCVAAVTLTACSAWDYVEEKYTGERRGQIVGGPRRTPMLNPKGAAVAEPKTNAALAATSAPKGLTPFDQYDDKGNQVKAENKSMLQAWFGDDEQAAPRKPFRGFKVAFDDVVQPAPIAPAVESMPTNKVPRKIEYRDDISIPEDENGVIVPLQHQRSDATESREFAQLQPAAGGAPAEPHLTDVPKKPAQFDAISKDKEADQKELELQHEKAMENKEKLEQEPSELKPITLPQVQGMINDIKGALQGRQPIVTAAKY